MKNSIAASRCQFLKVCTTSSRLLLIILLTTACLIVKSPASDNNFIEKYIQTNDVNSTIKLTMPEWLDNSLKIGKHIALMIENHSQEIIIFPPDYGIQILAFINGQWIEVENCLEYLPNTEIMLFPKGANTPGDLFLDSNPSLAEYQHPVTIRILVVGTIYKNDQPTDKKVAAYKDITLKP